jgi:hypothetical protein
MSGKLQAAATLPSSEENYLLHRRMGQSKGRFVVGDKRNILPLPGIELQ